MQENVFLCFTHQIWSDHQQRHNKTQVFTFGTNGVQLIIFIIIPLFKSQADKNML